VAREADGSSQDQTHQNPFARKIVLNFSAFSSFIFFSSLLFCTVLTGPNELWPCNNCSGEEFPAIPCAHLHL